MGCTKVCACILVLSLCFITASASTHQYADSVVQALTAGIPDAYWSYKEYPYTKSAAVVGALEKIKGISLEECKEICLNNTECKGFNKIFVVPDGTCFLLDETYATIANKVDSVFYSYFEKHYYGCNNSESLTYIPAVTAHVEEMCVYPHDGCTDDTAINYDWAANIDDGSCYYVEIYGCMDPLATNYLSYATSPDDSCTYAPGCTDSYANNYNSMAPTDDGSCIYVITGCTNSTAVNYNTWVDVDDGSCIHIGDTTSIDYPVRVQEQPLIMFIPVTGRVRMKRIYDVRECQDYCNQMEDCHGFSYLWLTTTPLCEFFTADQIDPHIYAWIDRDYYERLVYGCLDSTRLNYDPTAMIHNESACFTVINGCTHPAALNFDPTATYEDGHCYFVDAPGCMDSRAENYNSSATYPDGSCTYAVNYPGCTNALAQNFDELATIDDGSCIDHIWGCRDTAASNYESTATEGKIDELCYYLGGSAYEEYIPLGNFQLSSRFRNMLRRKMVPDLQECEWQCDVLPGCIGFNYRPHEYHPFCLFYNQKQLDTGKTFPREDMTYYERRRYGCAYSSALNYEPLATHHNESLCVHPVVGCMRPTAVNYNPSANVHSGYCSETVINGCTDSLATNYDSEATVMCVDCCTYPAPITGCANSSALNFDSDAVVDDGSCTFPVHGCTRTDAYNYESSATHEDGSCIVLGTTTEHTYIEKPYEIILSHLRNFANLKRASLEECQAECARLAPRCLALNFFYSTPAHDSWCQFWDQRGLSTSIYQPSAHGSSFTRTISGCLDTTAINYDSLAITHDAERCIF